MLQYAMFSNIASMIQKPPKDEKPPLVGPQPLRTWDLADTYTIKQNQ